METSLAATLGLGFLLGLRHALDADHVAAVGAMVSRHRSLTVSCLLGACWGLGHTSALLAAGTALIAFKLTVSPALEGALELGVAVMLVVIGGHVCLRALAGFRVHRHHHTHGEHLHSHFHLHAPGEPHADAGHVHLLRIGGRPFLVGLLQGMAGSAALMLLVLGAIPSVLGGLLYILVFGIGSTVGMLILSGLIGIPFVAFSSRSRVVPALLQVVAGSGSLILGVALLRGLGGG